MYILLNKILLFIFYISHLFQCVGTDRNIPDSVLQNRADTLHNILVTFHYEITEFSDQNILREKLNAAISSYLSLLLLSSNIFGSTTVLKFPKVRLFTLFTFY